MPFTPAKSRICLLLSCALLACLATVVWGLPAYAQQPPPLPANCITNTGGFGTGGSALLAEVLTRIMDVLRATTLGIYQHVISDPGFRRAVDALVVLYIAIYGIMIMFQMAPAKPGEVITRLVKIGILYTFISPFGGWLFFTQFVFNFFLGGMNELITLFNNAPLIVEPPNFVELEITETDPG